MQEFTNCPKCDLQTTDLSVNFCSACGGKMITSRKIIKFGRMSVVMGGFLVAMMVGIALWIRYGDATFEDTAAVARFGIILGILIVIFGVVGISAGVWMITHGKRNKMLTYIMMTLACAIAALVIGHNLSGETWP